MLAEISSPLKKILPEQGSIDLKISFAIVDFPEPDCPAIAKISPFKRLKLTSFTALIELEFEWKIPFLVNVLVKFSILRISFNGDYRDT